jgi:hypothetical protein
MTLHAWITRAPAAARGDALVDDRVAELASRAERCFHGNRKDDE